MNFAKVSRSLWHSRKFRSLTSDSERMLYLYLITCPHGNSAGCFVLPALYACADLGWSEQQYADGIHTLSKAGLIGFDKDEQTVRIVGWFRFNAPQNPKHAAGIRNVIASVQSKRLKALCLNELEAVLKGEPPPEEPPDPPSSGNGHDTVSEGYHYKKRREETVPEEKRNAAADAAHSNPSLDHVYPLPDEPLKQPELTAESELFRRGKKVLGANAGGVVKKLLKAKGGNIALARAAIETASTKGDPREYIARVIRGPADAPAAGECKWAI
jgi:hypothetical protein